MNEKSGKNDRIPDVKGDLKVKRLVVRDPFGLNGSFLYENIRLSRRAMDGHGRNTDETVRMTEGDPPAAEKLI